MRPCCHRSLFTLLLITVAVTSQASAGQHREPADDTGRLEHQLELGRHQRLLAVRRDPQNTLAAFTTDGCSGGMSAGWKFLANRIDNFHATHGMQPPWESCCVAHDRLYHSAGNRQATAVESFNARRDADLALKRCVTETGTDRQAAELAKTYNLPPDQVQALYALVADLMYRAVRFGGVPCSGLPWRWGYGWPECE